MPLLATLLKPFDGVQSTVAFDQKAILPISKSVSRYAS